MQTKAKNYKRIEGRIVADMGRFTPGTPIKQSKTLQRDSEHVWILVEDTLNTSCEAVSNLTKII